MSARARQGKSYVMVDPCSKPGSEPRRTFLGLVAKEIAIHGPCRCRRKETSVGQNGVSRQGGPCSQDDQSSDCSREYRERLPPNLQADCRLQGQRGEGLSEFGFHGGRHHTSMGETCQEVLLFKTGTVTRTQMRPVCRDCCPRRHTGYIVLHAGAMRSMQPTRLLKAWTRLVKFP